MQESAKPSRRPQYYNGMQVASRLKGQGSWPKLELTDQGHHVEVARH